MRADIALGRTISPTVDVMGATVTSAHSEGRAPRRSKTVPRRLTDRSEIEAAVDSAPLRGEILVDGTEVQASVHFARANDALLLFTTLAADDPMSAAVIEDSAAVTATAGGLTVTFRSRRPTAASDRQSSAQSRDFRKLWSGHGHDHGSFGRNHRSHGAVSSILA